MSRRVLTITFETPSCALVSGYGSRELLTELRNGRPPVWATRARAWVTQPATAKDIIAMAEMRGYDVVVTASCSPDDGEQLGGGRRETTSSIAEAPLW